MPRPRTLVRDKLQPGSISGVTQLHRGDRRNASCAESQGGNPNLQKDTHNSLRPVLAGAEWAPDQVRGTVRAAARKLAGALGGFGRPGGHSEGPNTRSHPELGRENPLRRWYCASRRGRVGRRQAFQTRPRPGATLVPPSRQATLASPKDPASRAPARQSRRPNQAPAPDQVPGSTPAGTHNTQHRGVEQPGSSSGS